MTICIRSTTDNNRFYADIYNVTGYEESSECIFLYNNNKMIAGIPKYCTDIVKTITANASKLEVKYAMPIL